MRRPPDDRARADRVVAAIEDWARSVALGEAIALSGGERPADLDLVGLMAWLEEFSGRWDFRDGRERNLVSEPALEPVADALGLVKGGMAPKGSYDHVLILGGLARACLARPLHAAKLIGEHAIEVGSVTALGGYRELQGDELGVVESVTGDRISGVGVADEFEAMDAGIRFAFELSSPSAERGEESDLVGASWRVREYDAKDRMPLHIVAAPSAEPGGRRTNTPDSIEWFATELAELQPGQRVLVITSDIYVPYQHADALRVMGLPCEVEVDTVGIQPGDVDPRLNQVFAPHAYLQETRSTILAFNKLFAAASTAR
jgi:hypothetical protein